MATYTPNYGLHQWVPEDQFLRTDFNEDFQKIDTAIKAAENKAVSGDEQVSAAVQAAQAAANRVLAALEPLSYNVYNLMLQNYYEGNATKYKKSLCFDGFRDKSGIDSLTGVVWDAAHGTLLLDGVGQGNISEATWSGKSIEIGKSFHVSVDWTPTGNGTLTKFTLPMMGTCQVSFYQGDSLLVSRNLSGGGSGTERISTTLSLAVTAGQTYTITVTNTGTSTLYLLSDQNDNFCYSMVFTPKITTSGTMIGVSQPVNGTFQRTKVWVRHSGGTVNCSLKGNSGSWKGLTRSSTRTTVNIKGVSCTESEFTLSTALTGPLQMKLDLSISSGSQMRVYDYGITLL